VHWRKVTVVGVGLLGGSVGLALKQRRLADQVVGFVRRRTGIRRCLKVDAVDVATCDIKRAVAGAEIVVICTPVAQMRAVTLQMLPFLSPGVVVTDVGSVKGSVVRDLHPLLTKAGASFVGSHPMAGSEKSGVEAATPDLFSGALCVVTPSPISKSKATKMVKQFWEQLGARVLRLAPDVHDRFVAVSSHLPQMLASALAGFVLDPTRPKAQRALCASGFRDTTRLASSSPEMWRDIAMANRRNLVPMLGEFTKELLKLRRALAKNEPEAVFNFFQTASQRRDKWLGFGARRETGSRF
jgi:prephenate dehydrogenase